MTDSEYIAMANAVARVSVGGVWRNGLKPEDETRLLSEARANDHIAELAWRMVRTLNAPENAHRMDYDLRLWALDCQNKFEDSLVDLHTGRNT